MEQLPCGNFVLKADGLTTGNLTRAFYMRPDKLNHEEQNGAPSISGWWRESFFLHTKVGNRSIFSLRR